jgi:cation diffusion facilitator family transporter
MAGGGHGTKAVIAALLANAGIAVAKFGGFVITGSGSMLAESVHSVADSGNQALLLLGGKKAQRAATPEHPFGYGRERYFWAFVVSIILFSVGGMFAVYEGIEKLRHPHEIESVGVAIGILLVALVLETLSLRTAVIEANKVRDPQTSWWSFIRRSKNAELPVVLMEDMAAEIGLVVALVAVSVAHVTGEPSWDALGTLTIGVLLIVIAVVLAIEMKGLLIGESATEADQQKIAAAIEVEPSVQRLIHMRTQHIGPEELLVGAKIELIPDLSVAEAAEAVNRIESSVRRAVPTARIMYLEPDIFRTAVPSAEDAPAHMGTPSGVPSAATTATGSTAGAAATGSPGAAAEGGEAPGGEAPGGAARGGAATPDTEPRPEPASETT